MQNALTYAVCCAEMQTPSRSVAATQPLEARPAVNHEALHGSMGLLETLRKLVRRQAEMELTWHILAACIIKAARVHFRNKNVWQPLRLPPEQRTQCCGGIPCGAAAKGRAAVVT